ncbi:MAG TPA: glycosyltransferase family 4 protein [Thermodesulfobacteriota bacterium]|nr:glycosyltransferase family 4 protein [Thermodesulfobacteriota bacterium]
MSRENPGSSPKKPRRAAYIGSPELFSRGASAIHVMKMCQAMGRLGIDTDLILATPGRTPDIRAYYGVDYTFKIIQFPYFKSSFARNVLHGVRAGVYTGLRKGRYDITVTRNIIYAFLAAGVFGVPVVYDAHHPLVTGARPLFRAIKDSPNLVRFSTNTRGLADIYLDEGLPPEKLVVAHNGVDLERYANLPGKDEARRKLGLALDKDIICYSGNIYEGRGIELLVDVSPRLPDAKFLIVGGRDEDVLRYRQLASEKNAPGIKLTSYVSHDLVPLYLAAADVLVMPYTSAMTIRGGTVAADFTSPIKLFEYMASGRPIVATSLPSVREILRDGENAVLVPPDSEDALYEGLSRVLRDGALAARIASGALADVRGYTWEERAKKLLGFK